MVRALLAALFALALSASAALAQTYATSCSEPNGTASYHAGSGGPIEFFQCIGPYMDVRNMPAGYPPANQSLIMTGGTWGQALIAYNWLYALVLQTDGNVVLYYTGGKYGPGSSLSCSDNSTTSTCYPVWNPLWASGTGTVGYGATLTMQTDGNLVLYDVNGVARWASGTNGTGAVQILMQNDGNGVIYDPANSPKWATNTAGRTQ